MNRKTILIVAALGAWWGGMASPPAAGAHRHHRKPHAAHVLPTKAEGWTKPSVAPGSSSVQVLGPSPPTQAELAAGRAAAVAYWHVQAPPCGRETVTVGPMTGEDIAEATFATCEVTFSNEEAWSGFPEVVCMVYVHEFGHLVLGPEYFAASNPSDPAHSPDPSNIMYGGAFTEAAEASTGCGGAS